jgi:alkaline phosphatase D
MPVSTSLMVASIVLVLGMGAQGCQPAVVTTESEAVAGPMGLEHGVAVGDVSSSSAVIWSRFIDPSRVRIEWEQDGSEGIWMDVTTSDQNDFIVALPLSALKPATEYRYRVVPLNRHDAVGPWDGRFTTAPQADSSASIRFIWSADVGGQQRCRQGEAGYPIFDTMRESRPMFALLLGDLIYADARCPSPPNAPGADFIAATLEQYRAKHRYQRRAPALQRFLASVPVYAIWDDHEVRNNFSGSSEPAMPIGRQAFFEYWPIHRSPMDPWRLYRSFRWGRTLELFILDTRQYRDRNADQDGPQKTMLGKAQREWLLEALTKSTAVWKVIVTSVPLSIPKGGTLELPGNDNWARGADGTGFQTELSTIVQTLLTRRIHNVVWLTADVHYTRAHAYDPDGDGTVDFHEFIAGPLSSSYGFLVDPDPLLRPQTIFSATGFSNFGLVTADDTRFLVEVRDDLGASRFTHTILVRSR